MAVDKRVIISEAVRGAITPPHPKAHFRTFVFGPYLKDDDVLTPPTSDPSIQDGLIEHARYLRYASSQAIASEGFKAEFGESKDVIDLWTANIKSDEPATGELHHAYRNCGAIVVFASSVGTFCEMGLFSAFDSIVRKMLILVHESHRDAKSFFNLGILDIIEQASGKTEFVDFSDHQKCVETVMKFVNRKYTKTHRDALFIEEGDRRRKELPRG